MLKMLMDPMGGIVMTNDGNAILREITVQHPAGKSIIEIARTQDEEVKIVQTLVPRTYLYDLFSCFFPLWKYIVRMFLCILECAESVFDAVFLLTFT